VQSEVGVQQGQQLAINEFMHPRIEENMRDPAGRPGPLCNARMPCTACWRFTREGRVVVTSSLRGYLLLWGLSRLRGMRRRTLRYEIENTRIEQWLAHIEAAAQHNPALAVEVAQCQRLVKELQRHPCTRPGQLPAPDGRGARSGTGAWPGALRELRGRAGR
jgi:indolepyruvate ferredoxin oxidoreductase beta subunit